MIEKHLAEHRHVPGWRGRATRAWKRPEQVEIIQELEGIVRGTAY
jgi:hypothetical protein